MAEIKVAISSGSKDVGKLTKVATYPPPVINDNQILFKAVAFASNPTDWKHVVAGWGTPGSIAGSDASGIVVKVGKDVKGFAVGDYVSSALHGNYRKDRGAFAEYVIADPIFTIKYDKNTFSEQALPVGSNPAGRITNFEGAAAITLGVATIGLSFSNSLKIAKDKLKNELDYILIWGGATATGIIGIQIAKLVYGLKVITTASSKNHKFLKSLGADEVFDYKDSEVVDQIVKAANGNIKYALDTVSSKQTFQQNYDATKGSTKVAFDSLLFLSSNDLNRDPQRKEDTFATTRVYLASGESYNREGQSIVPSKELLDNFKHFWEELIPPYLGQIITPGLRVLAPGLESASEALELLRQDKVSGEKVVFRI